MAKRIINTGRTPNDKTGDSLKLAFTKVNENFTELYTALGLNEAPLNLGAFEFTGSVLSTTDSTSITIDQATTITSDLTVGGDILPSTNLGGNLGSPTRQFKSLYVSTNTIYINNVPLSLDSSNNILVNGSPISGGAAETGDFTFESSNLYASGAVELTNGSTADEDWNAGIQIPARDTEGTLYIRNIGVEGNDLTLQTPHGTWTYGADGTFNLPGMAGGIGSYIQATNDITLNANGTEYKFSTEGWLTVPTGILGVVDEDIKIRAFDYDNDGFSVTQEVLDSGDFVRGRTQLERNEFSIRFYDGSGSQTGYYDFKNNWMDISGDIHGPVTGSTSLLVEAADNNSTVALKIVDNTATVQSSVAVKNNSITLSTGAGTNTLAFGSTGLTANGDLSIRVPNGIPNGVANLNNQGGWNQGYYSAIATTGGTGTGLTVNVAAGGGGYINISAISISNPGSGYTDGDVITINNENNLPATFTVTVSTTAWKFGTTGRTIFPNGTVPVHSYGAAGDKEGMVVFTDPYIYYCKQDYVDNTTDIWVRVAWTGTNW